MLTRRAGRRYADSAGLYGVEKVCESRGSVF